MLDDLSAEYDTQRRVGLRLEVSHTVGLSDVETLTPAVRDHRRIDVDAAARQAGVANDLEEFAAPAPEVEDRCATADDRQVAPLSAADDVLRTTEHALELEVGASRISTRPTRRRLTVALDPTDD